MRSNQFNSSSDSDSEAEPFTIVILMKICMRVGVLERKVERMRHRERQALSPTGLNLKPVLGMAV